MPRPPRISLPRYPQLVIQRSQNGQPAFTRPADYKNFRSTLFQAALDQECDVHAYALMPCTVMLLCTPKNRGGISKMMQSVGREYVPYYNASRGRCGTLWSGRYKSCLVQPTGFVVLGYAFVDRAPVRAGLADAPEGYEWSSARNNLSASSPAPLTAHPMFQHLGGDESERQSRYEGVLSLRWNARLLEEISTALNHGLVLGDECFKNDMASKHGIRVRLGKPGRPPKCRDVSAGIGAPMPALGA